MIWGPKVKVALAGLDSRQAWVARRLSGLLMSAKCVSRAHACCARVEFGRKLEKDVISETSGHFKRLLVAQCNADRDESQSVDVHKARCDAKDIFEVRP